MADPVHTGSSFAESIMHALLECLIIKEVIGLSKAVICNDINGESRVGAAHKHRFSRLFMSLQGVSKFIHGLPNQRLQPLHRCFREEARQLRTSHTVELGR